MKIFAMALIIAAAMTAQAKEMPAFLQNKLEAKVKSLAARSTTKAKVHAAGADTCANFTGTWSGKCPALSDNDDNVTFTISQSDCNGYTVGEDYTAIGSSGAINGHSPGYGSLGLLLGNGWSADRTTLNSLMDFSANTKDTPETIDGRALMQMKLNGDILNIRVALTAFQGAATISDEVQECNLTH